MVTSHAILVLLQVAKDVQAKGAVAIQEVEKQWDLLKKEAAVLKEKEKTLVMVTGDYFQIFHVYPAHAMIYTHVNCLYRIMIIITCMLCFFFRIV